MAIVKHLIRDRFSLGIFSGFIANLTPYALEFTLYYIVGARFVRVVDYASILVFGRLSENILESLMAGIAQSVFSALVGVIFAYLIPYLTYHHYLFKGVYYGLVVWFFINASTLAFRMPGLEELDTLSAATDFLSSILYGIVLAAVMYKLDPIAHDEESKA